MFAGTAYCTALNDRRQLEALDPALHQPPYANPPQAPVLYIKSGHCVVASGSTVSLPDPTDILAVGATIALQWTASGPTTARLALDLAVPHESFYRPAIGELARDGLLPVGAAAPRPDALDTLEIVTEINGTAVHHWNLSYLVRGIDRLIADVTTFMSLLPGDMLLVGTAGDRPTAKRGDHVRVSAAGFAPVEAVISGSNMQAGHA